MIHLAKPLQDQLKIEVGELSISAPFHAGASHAGFHRGPGMNLLIDDMGHGITHGFELVYTLEIAGPDSVSPNRGNSEALHHAVPQLDSGLPSLALPGVS